MQFPIIVDLEISFVVNNNIELLSTSRAIRSSTSLDSLRPLPNTLSWIFTKLQMLLAAPTDNIKLHTFSSPTKLQALFNTLDQIKHSIERASELSKESLKNYQNFNKSSSSSYLFDGRSVFW